MSESRAVLLRGMRYMVWQAPPPGHRWVLVKDADGVERYRAVPIERTEP